MGRISNCRRHGRKPIKKGNYILNILIAERREEIYG
jgi:hypothetical protein